jgi:tetratricopeptide (TPR) repeat protein
VVRLTTTPGYDPAVPSRRVTITVFAGVLAAGTVACGHGASQVDSDVAVRRGLAALAAGNTGAAVGEFVTALEADPTDTFALYNLGYIARSNGERASAEAYYRAALDANPRFQAALFNLALLRERAGGTQEAIELYRQVISLDPDDAEAHLSLGLLLLRGGRAREAEVEIQIAIRSKPSLIDRLERGENAGAAT